MGWLAVDDVALALQMSRRCPLHLDGADIRGQQRGIAGPELRRLVGQDDVEEKLSAVLRRQIWRRGQPFERSDIGGLGWPVPPWIWLRFLPIRVRAGLRGFRADLGQFAPGLGAFPAHLTGFPVGRNRVRFLLDRIPRLNKVASNGPATQ